MDRSVRMVVRNTSSGNQRFMVYFINSSKLIEVAILVHLPRRPPHGTSFLKVSDEPRPRRDLLQGGQLHRQRSFWLERECVDRLSIRSPGRVDGFGVTGWCGMKPCSTTIARNYLRRLQKRFSLAHRVWAHLGSSARVDKATTPAAFLLIGVCPWRCSGLDEGLSL